MDFPSMFVEFGAVQERFQTQRVQIIPVKTEVQRTHGDFYTFEILNVGSQTFG
jgi:hypothetical protein